MAMKLRVWRSNQLTVWQPNLWDVFALVLLFSIFALLAWTAKQVATPYHLGQVLPIHLSIHYLPQYVVRTVFRMGIALMLSLLFTFVFGTLAAKNKHAERIIIPAIDVLQSVPILGYLSITVVIFIVLFPNSLLGPECAAIFAIFTSQAWNMCLGFYQSLRTVPYHLREASAVFQLSAWQRFWRVEVPFAIPSLIWNMMMSMSAGWFFVVASEAISVNNQKIMLPGVGSYIATAIANQNTEAIIWAIITMLVVILLYDQLLFRPLIQWGEKFKFEGIETERKSDVLLIALLRRTRVLFYLSEWLAILSDGFVNYKKFAGRKAIKQLTILQMRMIKVFIIAWYIVFTIASIAITIFLLRYIFDVVPLHEAWHVIVLGFYTSIRVVVLIVLCSLIWVPVGVWVGLHGRVSQIVQPIVQFLAAFPANLLFPVVAMFILKYQLNVEIWTAPLMILSTQWYILFNVIAGTSALPKDLVQVSQNLNVKKWLWWKKFILPGIFPYFITGAITAAGGAWNASVIAEVVDWGHTKLIATGLGAYITQVTGTGDFPRLALGISVMCLYVILFNRLLWKPLYDLSEKRFQLA